MEVQDSKEVYGNIEGDELQENLRYYFQFILDEWEPKPITPEVVKKAIVLLRNCQGTVPRNTTREGWGTGRLSGYYLNDTYQGAEFPEEVKSKISKAKNGFVVYDDWNELMIVIEEKSVYSLFYWATNA